MGFAFGRRGGRVQVLLAIRARYSFCMTFSQFGSCREVLMDFGILDETVEATMLFGLKILNMTLVTIGRILF